MNAKSKIFLAAALLATFAGCIVLADYTDGSDATTDSSFSWAVGTSVGDVQLIPGSSYSGSVPGITLSTQVDAGMSFVHASGTPTTAGTYYVTSNMDWRAVITVSPSTATYTVSFSAGTGGSVSSSSIPDVPSGSSITVNGNAVTINGSTVTANAGTHYDFSSWSNTSGTITGDRTITANFTPKSYTITFSAGYGGTVSPSSTTAVYGATISTSGNTVKINGATAATASANSGYSFWTWTNASGTVNGNRTITANFASDTTYYDFYLYYNANGGSGAPSSQSYTSTSSSSHAFTISNTEPTRSGYTFQSWNTKSNGTGTTYYPGGTVYVPADDSVTLYAVWQEISYTDSYFTWYKDVAVSDMQLIPGSSYTGAIPGITLSTSVDAGQSFIHAAGTPTTTGTYTVTSNLYWRAIVTISDSATVSIAVNDSNYGSVSQSTVTIPVGTTYSTSGTTLTFNTSPATTITASPASSTAQWTYALSSWSPASGTISGPTTITANFARSANQYTVTFAVSPAGYGTVSAASYTDYYGAPISYSDNVLDIGTSVFTATPAASDFTYDYSFISWSNVPANLTQDVTITANFTRSAIAYTDAAFTWVINNPVSDMQLIPGSSYSGSIPGITLSTSVDAGTSFIHAAGTPTTAGTFYVLSDADWRAVVTVLDTATVTIAVNDANYGSVSQSTVTVPVGTTYSTSGTTLTFNTSPATTVTATPAAATTEYTYSLDSWSPSSGTISAPATITANFVRASQTYTDVPVTWYVNNPVSNMQLIPGETWTGSIPGITLTSSYDGGFYFVHAEGTPTTAGTYNIISDMLYRAIVTVSNDAVITIAVNEPTYGSVDETTITIPVGTTYSTSGTTLTFNTSPATVVTATPTASTAQWTYALGSWSPASGTVTAPATITANFTRTANTYTVTFVVNPAGWGTVSEQTYTDYYGAPISYEDNRLDVGLTVITATPRTPDETYTYSFDSWSNVPANLTQDVTITANFTREVTPTQFTYWENGQYNGKVDMLFKFDNAASKTHIMSMDLYTGTVGADERTTWTDSGRDLTISVSYYPSLTVSASLSGMQLLSHSINPGKWNTFVLSIDTDKGIVTVTPIRVFNSFVDYTVYDSQTKTVLDFSSELEGAAVYTIAHSESGSGASPLFSVVNTSVFLNTYGVVLYNPTINLYDYFPQYSSIRVNFYSFALYGESITVNGQTYDVVDGKITVQYVSDHGDNYLPNVMPNETVKTRTFTLTNIYVTYQDNHCYLTFVNDRFTLDLGAYMATQETISMQGLWYMATMVYEPYTATEKTLSDWKTLPELSKDQMLLIFLAILAVAGVAVALHAKKNGKLGYLDVAIIGAAALLAFLMLG